MGDVMSASGGAARIACFVLVALLIQQVLGYDPAVAGLAMLPTSLAGFAVSILLLPRALARFGPEKVAVTGLGLLVVAHLLFATIGSGTPYVWGVLPVLLIAAAGVTFSFTPTTLVLANGRVRYVLGSPHGGRKISAMAHVLAELVDFGHSPAAAVASPRIHCEGDLADVRVAADVEHLRH